MAGETSGFLVVFFSLLALINFSLKGFASPKVGLPSEKTLPGLPFCTTKFRYLMNPGSGKSVPKINIDTKHE